ncbi:MAG: hypothetical protein LH603_04275 [Pseudonocardia sp.]|nr:hypothetical protein [Pseudonocardia sp.]
MTVLVPLGLAVLGLVVVIVFSERLVKATVGVARTAGLSTFLIAVIFLGFDPENLAVGAVGAQQGAAGLALGTVLGSAMVAIALAVGVGVAAVIARCALPLCPARSWASPSRWWWGSPRWPRTAGCRGSTGRSCWLPTR